MATTLNVGELAIIQYGSDGSDVFTFVILTDIDADTVISFTDKGYDATTDSFVTNEGTFDWTPGVALPAGTVITIDGNGGLTAINATTGAALGTISNSSGAFNLATAGDSIFAYQGDITGTSADAGLIYGVNFGDDVGSNPLGTNGWNTLALGNDANESNLPDELNALLNGGINASYGNPAEIDNGYYNGPTTGTVAQILAAIADPLNWITSNAEQGAQTFPVFGPDTAPELANLEMTALSFDELGGEQTVTDSLTLTDSGNLTGASLTISAGFDMANDVLNFTDQNGITGVYDAMTGLLTLSGTGSAADYQTAIRSITYDNVFTTESTATRTVTIEVTDGANAPISMTRDIDFVIDNTVEGTAGVDALRGGFGTDVINGNGSNDRLFGEDGTDTLNGGDGNDYIDGGAGADVINGGAGIDGVFHNGATEGVVVNLTTGGSAGDADADTYISIERVFGTGFDDVLTGDDNNNVLSGVNGMDTLNGEGGDDILYGLNDDDTLNGGDGEDRLFGGNDNDTLNGDAGDDVLLGNAGNDIISGGLDNDLIFGGAGDDDINGGDGNDIISAGADNDTVMGGVGNDIIRGDSGINSLFGDAGNDTLFSGTGADFLDGGAGIDVVTYAASEAGVTVSFIDDTGFGGNAQGDTFSGIENIFGSQFDDDLTGDAMNNTISALSGNDIIDGDAGNDKLFGGAGNDSITGGAGNDFLLGQADADTFIFGTAHGADRIVDFEQGVDIIEFDISSGITDFSNLTITQTGAHVLITSLAGTIAVNNSLVADFDASDFSFATPPMAEPLNKDIDANLFAGVYRDMWISHETHEADMVNNYDFFA